MSATTAILRLQRHGKSVVFEDPGAEIDESVNDSGVRAFLRRGHFYEEEFLEYIRSLHRTGTYVDAGGFIGTHAIYFAALCDSDRVYTFEPRSQPREELERNIAANHLGHKVTIVPIGLAAEHKSVTVDLDSGTATFECVPLDDVVNEPVGVIKIDVEGMEVDVLRGASRILDEFHPVVFAEAHTREARQAIADCLASHGYARTGRVFNATPTYEFAFVPESVAGEELRRAYDEIGRLHDTLDSELARVRAILTEAQLKYRKSTETVRSLSDDERRMARELREKEAELQRSRSNLLAATRTVHDLQTQKSQLERALRAGLMRADRVKNTLSFQLGHALIHATKSRQALKSLPASLLELRKEAARRRGRGSRGARFDTTLDSGEQPLVHVYEKPAPPPKSSREKRFRAPAALAQPGDAAQHLKQLRVACILDEFSGKSFGPECELLHLRCTDSRLELDRFKPDLLFVESAWRGRDDGWAGKIGQVAPELQAVLAWCRSRRVPTAFWNKEDPVHFSTFRNTVSLFDFVFTTDVDCVHRYKELLGHDRVYVLPFACQPAMHNPLEKYERKDALCFAGAYYARYPDRQRDFLGMLHELQEHWPIDIFDRNHGDTNPDYRFPEAYRHLIRGKLPFEQIDRAYKGYQYAINLNSIKFSQTMFARRVFEVLACNTVVVSNFSRGIRQLLGDLVIATDDPRSHVEWLRETTATPARLRKFKLAGLRKTLAEHTYQDRLGYVASKVFDIEPLVLLPEVMVVGAAHSRAEAENVRAAFDRQAYARKRLLLIAPEHVCRDLADAEGVAHLALEGSSQSPLTDHLGKSRYVASMVPDDYYGPQYLTDLALGSRYWSGRGIGKASHFEWRGSEPTLVDDGAQYKPAAVLQARAAIMASPAFAHVSVGEYVDRVTTFEIDGDDLVAIDEMSYCRDAGNRATEPSLVAAVDDPSNLDTGMSLPRLLAAAEEIEGKEDDGDETLRALAPAGLAKLFPAGQREAVVVVHDREGMTFDASLPADSHQYVHASRDIDLASLGFSETGKLFVDATLGLNMEVVLFFMDPAGARVSHVIAGVHTNLTVDIPPGTFSVRLAFRISGSGRATVSAVVLGHVSADEPARIFGRSDVLVLTNMYPSADALYQNAFVHRRVLEYARRGKRADIFCLRAGARLGYYEFDGVDVTRGGKHALQNVLRTRQHRTILVHFLDEAMWSVLEPHLDDLKVIVWLHGSEVQPWHRRTYNYTTPAQLEAAKIASERRVSFWQGILREPHPNFKLVFVSEYLAEEVQEDLGLRLPPDMFTVIHNLIDTELFSYQRKDPEQRKRILSIRPYASRKYANDLAVDAIVELSKEPFFDELEFRIIGDGLLFDETVEPLRDFRNVIIDKGFLTHAEIAALHKDYGVFLVPTRADTQGVSRDEAMASGLVPVTSAVTAVPEFVDEECGFMAPFDDASGLAAAIKTLYLEPDRFARMSAAAAARVRRQSTADLTAQRELELFRDPVR